LINTSPLFIVSTGRSGSYLMKELFKQELGIEIHHEYACTHTQEVAVKYYAGLMTYEQAKYAISRIHGAAIHYSKCAIWVDSSSKLSWLVDILYDLYPNAKFIHIVRNGRKVVSSYYNKLGGECYDDYSVGVLSRYLVNPDIELAPPPEKKYWWCQPLMNTEAGNVFSSYDQFERICFHWREVNQKILDSFKGIPKNQKLSVKFEELVASPVQLQTLVEFVGVRLSDRMTELVKRPINVNVPKNFSLTPRQEEQFCRMCSDMMDYFQYDNKEYGVQY